MSIRSRSNLPTSILSFRCNSIYLPRSVRGREGQRMITSDRGEGACSRQPLGRCGVRRAVVQTSLHTKRAPCMAPCFIPPGDGLHQAHSATCCAPSPTPALHPAHCRSDHSLGHPKVGQNNRLDHTKRLIRISLTRTSISPLRSVLQWCAFMLITEHRVAAATVASCTNLAKRNSIDS